MAARGDSVFHTDDQEFDHNLPRRNRAARGWQIALQASTIVGILVLVALLLNILDGAFGFVALQNTVNPEDLVAAIQAEEMLAAPNTLASEDDEVLASGVAESPNAIGFFGYAYYQKHADELKTVAVEGVAPSAETVDSGQYGLSRPLYLYSTAEIMQEKPQVASFINFYLTYVNEEIVDVGYFPASTEALNASKQAWLDAMGQ